MRRLIAASLLTTVLVMSGDVLGQIPGGIQVSFVDSGELEVQVGGVTTLVYRVSSSAPIATTLHPELELPSGWRAVSKLAPIEVSDSEPVVGFLTLRIPAFSPAGRYRVGLGFRTDSGQAITDQAGAMLVVPEVSGISLSIPSLTEYVRAGEPLQISISVTNQGNSPTAVHLDATGPIEAEIRLDSTRIQLAPRATRVVQLYLTTGSRVSHETIQEIYIHARGEKNPSVFKSVTARIHVIPGYGQLNGKLKTQPLKMTLQSVGDETGGAAQIGAKSRFQSLGGVLDLDVMLADRAKTPMFGSRDTYRMSYTSSRLVVRLGDQTQNLSPLSTHGDYGSGVGVEYQKNRFSVRGFAQRSRHQFPSQSLAGWSMGYRPNDKVGLSLNAIVRDGPYAGSFASARGQLNPIGPTHDLEFECGLDSNAGFDSPSCSAIVRGSAGSLTYNGTLSSLATSYPGYEQGLKRQYARLSYRLPLGITIEGSVRSQKTSYLKSSTRTTDLLQVGGTWNRRFGRVRSFSRLFYIMRSWDYTSGDLLIDRAENTLRLQQGINTGRVDLHGTIDLGRGHSIARSYDGSGRRYQAAVRYTPSRRLSVSATGEIAKGFLNGSTRSTDRRMMNLQVRGKVTSLTDLSVTFYRNVIQTFETVRYSSYRAAVMRSFRNGQELRLQAQISAVPNSNPGTTADYQLAYTVPLNVPVGRPSKQEAIIGRVYDAESGEGIEGVLLFLGSNATISDVEGRFEVLRPLDYATFLSLDYRTIGLESVPLISMPHEIAQGVDQGVLEIPIARSAQVDGTVTVYGSETGDLLIGDENELQVPLSGLGNVVLSLSNALNEYRTRTSAAGRYQFRSIVPGDYLLRVVLHPRLENHVFESDSSRVTVRGAETANADFRVLPNRPKIRLVNQDKSDVVLAPVRVARSTPADQGRETRLEKPVSPESLRADVPPVAVEEDPALVPPDIGQAPADASREVRPEWSYSPSGTFSIAVPVSSVAAADRLRKRVEGDTLPADITTRSPLTTNSVVGRPLKGEGVQNLLKRHGLKFTPEAIAEFYRLNPQAVNDPYGLRKSLEYLLPIDMKGPDKTHVLRLGKFRTLDQAVAAISSLERRLPWAAYVIVRN